MTQALEGEPDGVDEVDAGAHEGVAELEAEQIVPGLGGAVFNRMEQGHVRAGEAGEHHGIAAVALALVAGDGVQLAGIGDDDGGPEAGEVTADPRAVRPGFERHGGGGIVREQAARGGHAVIGPGDLRGAPGRWHPGRKRNGCDPPDRGRG
jgi:hypothetical protein